MVPWDSAGNLTEVDLHCDRTFTDTSVNWEIVPDEQALFDCRNLTTQLSQAYSNGGNGSAVAMIWLSELSTPYEHPWFEAASFFDGADQHHDSIHLTVVPASVVSAQVDASAPMYDALTDAALSPASYAPMLLGRWTPRTPLPCPYGQFLSDPGDAGVGGWPAACLPWTVCAEAEYEATAPSAARDRECLPLTVCKAFEEEQQAATSTSDRICTAVRTWSYSSRPARPSLG